MFDGPALASRPRELAIAVFPELAIEPGRQSLISPRFPSFWERTLRTKLYFDGMRGEEGVGDDEAGVEHAALIEFVGPEKRQ